ncbi:MAG: hypothetical protein AAAB16_18965 [Pseudomonas sp.]|uniref:hypothetical protein n=1 Tax=Pseudomonas sp. TaxID=306 RepID=UPI0030F0843D
MTEFIAKITQNKLIAWPIAVVLALGAFAGAMNEIISFINQEFWRSENWLLKSYSALTDWLTVAVPIPLWVLVPTAVLAMAWMVFLRKEISEARSQSEQLKGEIESLRNPEEPSPDSTQERVLFWAVLLYDMKTSGEGAPPSQISEKADIELTIVEAALDELKNQGLVQRKKYREEPVTLTQKGRKFISQGEPLRRYSSFRIRVSQHI